MTENKRPVSPVNGQPLPEGRRFEPGEKQREISSKAGKKSVEIRRARKTLREELQILLSEQRPGKDGKEVQVQTAISTALIKAALNGNVRAFETIRDTIGEKPMENITVSAGSFEALNEAFESMKGEK